MLAAVAAPVRARALALALVAAVCLASSATAQRGNFVDDGGFDYAEAAPPPRAAPRPAPAFRTAAAADTPRPTPVPILKQINRHNEDGSYTYGYEGADGAFKIETKLPTGEVMGKYGYVDDTGKVRVIEYGANKYGFQPAGEGITVAPPTLVDETATKKGGEREPVVFDDGQYYEEEPVRAAPAPRPVPRPVSRPAPRPAPRPAQQPQYAEDTFTSFQSSQNFGPSSRAATAPAFQPSSRAAAAPAFQPSSRPAPTPPRFEVPGAIPVGPAPSFSQPRAAPRPQSYFSPAPVRAAAPAPVYESAPVPVARPQPSRGAYGRSSGILDQLEKDFALPSNSAPALHDITFGSF